MAFSGSNLHAGALLQADTHRAATNKNVILEAFPKLKFWESFLEFRSFARLKA
jgi:hypothetical protein